MSPMKQVKISQWLLTMVACAIGIWVFYLLLRVGFYGIFTSFFEVRERFLKLTIKKEDQHGKR